MQADYQAGKLSLNPTPGAVNLVFTDYAQPGDKMTVTFDTAAKKISGLSIDTYMGQEKDVVTSQVQSGACRMAPAMSRKQFSMQQQKPPGCVTRTKFQPSQTYDQATR